MASNATYAQCGLHKESTIHVLLDYPYTTVVWMQILHLNMQKNFHSLPLVDWLYFNLCRHQQKVENMPWPFLFGITSWQLWKWCNTSIFERCKLSTASKLSVIKSLAATTVDACSISDYASEFATCREKVLISWLQPRAGCVVVNSDRAQRCDINLAST